jgi:hypothetical protein
MSQAGIDVTSGVEEGTNSIQIKVCRSVNLHTFKRINQLDTVINYRFIVCHLATCLGQPYAHHQEPINCSDSGRSDRPRPTALLPPRSYVKPEAAAAVDRLLIMGIMMPETC